MSSPDPELERLVADMSVTQTPVPRRDDGVVRCTQCEQGTLDGSTVTGMPFTVWSGHLKTESCNNFYFLVALLYE